MNTTISLKESDKEWMQEKAKALGLSLSAFIRVATFTYKIEGIPPSGKRNGIPETPARSIEGDRHAQ